MNTVPCHSGTWTRNRYITMELKCNICQDPCGAVARCGGPGRPGCRGTAGGRLADLRRVMTGPWRFQPGGVKRPGLATCADLHLAPWSAGMPVGPDVDEVEHGADRLGRHEAEHLLQNRVHDRVQPVLGAPGQVGDQAVRPLGAQAVLDPGVGLCADRHVVGERVGHRGLLSYWPEATSDEYCYHDPHARPGQEA